MICAIARVARGFVSGDGIFEGGIVMSRRLVGSIAGIAGVLFVLCALSLSGCNTVRGVGTDIQNAADQTQQAIDKAFEGD